MRPIERPDFSWSVVVNWSKNTNKVLSLYGGVQRIVVGSYWGVSVTADSGQPYGNLVGTMWMRDGQGQDRKSTRLNSSHSQISYAVFCLKKKTHTATARRTRRASATDAS